MLKTFHQGAILPDIALAPNVALEPFSKIDIQEDFSHGACPNGILAHINSNSLPQVSLQTNYRQQPTGPRSFFAVAEEQVGVAGGAEVADENICVGQAGGE